MKRKLIALPICLLLMIVLSLSVSAAYTLPTVNIKDTVRSGNLYSVETGEYLPFRYEIPKDGAAVLIFYKTSCSNCQSAFTSLNQQPWAANDLINFYAIESTDHGIEDIKAFRSTFIPDASDSITWLDSTGSRLCADYLSAAGLPTSWTWPVVVICTETNGAKTIRAVEMAALDTRYWGNTLETLLNLDFNVEKTVPLTVSVVENHDLAAEASEILNQYRRQEGLSPLHPNKKLTELAMLRAAELQIYPAVYSRPDNKYNYDIVWDHLPAITTGNAIVAMSCDSPEELLTVIQNDSFFKFLLLDDDFTRFGVGCVKVGSTYHWAVTLTDDNGYEEPPCQTGILQTTYTIPTYLSNLEDPNLYPKEITMAPQSDLAVQLYGNAAYAQGAFMAYACSSEIRDANGQTIAHAALQEDGTVLVTAVSVGVGELQVYGWEGQKTPFTAKITVSDDPAYRPNKIHTTVRGNGSVLLSRDTAPMDTEIGLTPMPDEGWWLASLRITDANGDTLSCYSDLEHMFFFMPMSDVYVTAEFLPDSVPKTQYPITMGSSGSGHLDILSGYSAYATSTVTVAAEGTNGHVLSSLTVTDEEDNPIEVTDHGDGTFAFQMPASAAMVKAVFAPAEGYEITVETASFCTVTPSRTNAAPGETITVTVIPDDGYEIESFHINLWDDEFTWTDENTLTFTMPNNHVEISVYCVQAAATSGTFGENLTWQLKDGTLTISGNGSMDRFENTFDVPWNDSRDSIQTVVMEEGVTDIAPYAFSYLDNLTAVTVPASVEFIDSWAFLNAEALTAVQFKGSAPSRGIDDSAFAWVSATVTVPADDRSWTDEVTQDYGGSLTWNHSWSTAVTEPTCTEGGFTQYTCSCGDSEQGDFTPALGHAYTHGSCTRCGAVDPDYTAPVANPFVDVWETDWFYTPVLWAVKNGITGGTSPNTFSPNAPCTRGQVVTFLWAAKGRPAPNSLVNPFTDVSERDYYYQAVLWAVENGITGGTSPNTFSPEAPCTRAHVVTFLWAADGKPPMTAAESPFLDVQEDAYYRNAVLWAAENEITGGIGAGLFGPDQGCTRNQIVTFLYKAAQ